MSRTGDLSSGLRAFYRGYAAARGKTRYGDKTPMHATDIDVLSRVLPEARFIHIIRDGRDVAASLRGLPFAPGDGGLSRSPLCGETRSGARAVPPQTFRTTPRSATRPL